MNNTDFSFLMNALSIAHIKYSQNEPIAKKTTFKIGSTANLFILPQSIQELASAVSAAKSMEVPYFILGGGSNVVFPDTPYNGIVISTQNINNILTTDTEEPDLSKDEVLVSCQCGTPMATFVNFCTSHNFSGAEQFAGLPGTIGGAVYMNARCFEKSISDILYNTQHIELFEHGLNKIISNNINQAEWDYKVSPFQNNKNKVIAEATFRLKKKTPAEHTLIEEECKKYINERVSKGHFKYPSAGSVFKNNHSFGAPSGKLIDEVGLKGTIEGGAQIAPFHGNFIININNAKAQDVKKLVQLCQNKVYEKFGFNLEPEIIFL